MLIWKQDLSEISHWNRFSYRMVKWMWEILSLKHVSNPRINDYKISAISSCAMLKIAVNNKDEWLCKKWWDSASVSLDFFFVLLFFILFFCSSINSTFFLFYKCCLLVFMKKCRNEVTQKYLKYSSLLNSFAIVSTRNLIFFIKIYFFFLSASFIFDLY